MRSLVWAIVLTEVSLGGWAQVLIPRTTAPAPAAPANGTSAPAPVVIALVVPAGTPLKVALDKEVRIKQVGQPVHGKLLEPVYAFDKLVVPAGSEVAGKVSAIDQVSKKTRVLAAMNANLSPYRKVQVEFDQMRLADGRKIALNTTVSAAPSGVLEFVPASDKSGAANAGKTLAANKVREARQQIKQEWDVAKQQWHQPDKVHRAERMAIAQLPYHPQYMDAGTAFDVDLNQALDFGRETVMPQALAAIGTPPPPGSVVHAMLATPLSSASSKKGDPVEAVITQPLIVGDRLFVPQGSRLKGTVLQARPARRLGRNGQLRIVFHQLVPPSGVEQQIQASLEAVAVAKEQHLALDSEGGAQVTTPKTRYLTTGIAVALAASSASPDHDARLHDNGGDAGGAAANGASGYKAVGMIVGALAHSRALGTGMGVYGASMSVYSRFLTRGRDVIYAKDMSMVIGLGTRDEHIPTEK
ncbi:MAG: hypothetical protein LAN64_15725 [Acidobacteriia bacterium]|nr:hypothetical protein [Terriglobia bacterium]